MSISAESIYLFRHAVLRDAAYQLMTPELRVEQHAAAFRLVERAHGGPPLELAPLDSEDAKYVPHAIDAVAAELLEHLDVALTVTQFDSTLVRARVHYLRRAAEHAGRHFQNDAAIHCWTRLAQLVSGSEEGACWRRAGSIAYHTGQLKRAEEFWQRSLDVLQDTDDTRAIGGALSNLGIAKNRQGQKEEAERLFTQALQIHRETGNRQFEANTCHALGGLYIVTGRTEEAQRMLELALEINRELGNHSAEGMALSSIALIHERNGDRAKAADCYEQALKIHEGSNPVWVGITLGNFALLRQQEAKYDESERMLERALEIHREVGNRSSEGMALGVRATLQTKSGRTAEALQTYQEALALLRETGNARGEGAYTCSYAMLLLERGSTDEARRLWRHGAGLLEQVGDTHQLQGARETMKEACTKAGVEPFTLTDSDATESR